MEVSRLTWMAAGSLVVLALLVWQLFKTEASGRQSSSTVRATPGPTAMLYCAASNRAAMESIVQAYAADYARQVEVQYGGSQTLLASLQVSRTGDLYLPADASYIKLAQQLGLVSDSYALASMHPVLVVKRGNPRQLSRFADLLRRDVRVSFANPETAAIGKLIRQAWTDSGRWERFQNAITVLRTNVAEVANDVLIEACDAGVIYDAMLIDYPELEAVELEPLSPLQAQVEVAIIGNSPSPETLHFLEFLRAPTAGGRLYRQHGFSP